MSATRVTGRSAFPTTIDRGFFGFDSRVRIKTCPRGALDCRATTTGQPLPGQGSLADVTKVRCPGRSLADAARIGVARDLRPYQRSTPPPENVTSAILAQRRFAATSETSAFRAFRASEQPRGGLSTIVGAVEKVAQNLGITKKAVHHHIDMAVRAADATFERAPAANVAHLPLAKISPSAGLPRCRTFKLAASGRQCSAKAHRVLY
jgi:hypothetical protein